MYNITSLARQHSLTTKLRETSRDVGWQSTLLELHRCDERHRDFELVPTPDTHLVLQLEGRHRLEVLRNGCWNGAEYGRDAVGMAAGGVDDRLRSLCEAPFDIAHLYIPEGIMTEASAALKGVTGRAAVPPPSTLRFDDPTIAATIRALLRALRAGACDLYAEQAIHWLAVHLLSTHHPAGPIEHAGKYGGIEDKRLKRAIGLMRECYARPLTLDQLAAEAGISKFHFARLFKIRTGQSPHVFLSALRMAAARKILTNSDLPISEVAHRVGYKSTVQFGAAFKSHSSVTPKKFRTSVRTRHESD